MGNNLIISLIKRNIGISLFILLFLIYSISFNPYFESGDPLPASLLPFSIFEDHDVYLDEFENYFQASYTFSWMVREIDGHYLSAYPIVTPVLILPIYIIPYVLIKWIDYPIDMLNPGFQLIVAIMEKLSASIIAALAGIFVYLSLDKLITRKIAALTTFIFAFATNTWAISSHELWQHGLVELLLAMQLYIILLNEVRPSNKLIMSLGALSGLYIFNRPSDSILLIPIFAYIFILNFKKISYYLLPFMLTGLIFFSYNYYYFNSLFGGYTAFIGGLNLSYNTFYNFMGLLISPNRGLLVYSPIVILAILGYLNINGLPNDKIRYILYLYGPIMLLQILLYSSFDNKFIPWWAGGSYGPRFLTGILPILAIYIGLYLNSCSCLKNTSSKNIIYALLISVILIWSIFVQIVGAFYYPNGLWDVTPENINEHPERAWNWSDMQILRSFNAGPTIANPLEILESIYNHRQDILSPISRTPFIHHPYLEEGWHGLEMGSGTPTRWIQTEATFRLCSDINTTSNLSFRAISFHRSRTLEIYSNDILLNYSTVPTHGFVEITTPVYLHAGVNTIKLHIPEGCERPRDMKELNNLDPRCLSIAVQNVSIA